MKTDLGFDPFDPSQTQHMWDLMRELRRRAPIAHIGEGFVYVARYEDAREVLRDQKIFSNAGGMRPTGTEIPLHDASIGETVPPEHPPIRRLALAAATGGGVVERMRSHARAVSQELLEGIASRGAGDLIEGLSLALTNRVIGGLLGVPAEECDRLAAWSEEIMHSTLTVTNRTERGVGYEGAFPEFTSYLDSLIEKGLGGMSDAKREPEDETDTLTRIVRTGLEIAELDTRIIRMILMNLVLGGTATTRDFIGSLIHELLREPRLYARIRDDRALVPVAVQESLRHAPPVLYVIRTCTESCELSGERIEAGERVIVGIASANRDERIYEDPDSFSLDRHEPAMHLSFGYGPHFCVGSFLARMEGEEALNALLDRFAPGELELEPDFELELMPLPYMYGPVALPIRVQPGSARH
ncbi:MAG: cytochrome P450 [Deltaproteobacteria bacterium]|jgi:cytochrome P450|nr:cytochrome P450 [Deltaproteobacteria bacterium]MBW2500606.1 cytochrome P450 [Deltaproteobacteria bacterium]